MLIDMDYKIELEASHKERRRLTGKRKFKFEIGVQAVSNSVLDKWEKTKKLVLERNKTPDGSFSKFVEDSFARHCLCDWGDISLEDKSANDEALQSGCQLFSTYMHRAHPTICVLTEADRLHTSIGLLEDFQ